MVKRKETYKIIGLLMCLLFLIVSCNKETVEQNSVFFMPNTFTPDGNSFNEEYRPYGIPPELTYFRFTIYNKWEEKLFESLDAELGWDGKYNNELVPADIYPWIIEYQFDSTEIEIISGHVSVLK